MEKKIIQIPREDGEVFKLIPTTTRYFVSNKGRALKLVYDRATDTYLERPIARIPSKNKTGRIYYDINIQLENSCKSFRCRLSRAICKTFLDESFGLLYKDDKRVAEHKDGNYDNNDLSNLQITSQSFNIRKAIEEEGKSIGIPKKSCVAYNINTKEVRRYESTRDLSRDLWNDDNPGRFNSTYVNKRTSREGWRVAYTLDEIQED